MTPLNPTLYNRLCAEFGYAGIVHPGMSAVSNHEIDPLDSRLKTKFVTTGEHYKTNCPYCGDTRGRLYISYLFGVPDELTGNKNLFLAHCFNEDCLSVRGRSLELYERIYSYQNSNLRSGQLTILPGEIESTVLKEASLPGLVISIDKLPFNDPTILYLRERGFDIKELADTYKLSYCLNANSNYPMAHGRIIIPIYMNKLLVGWQARFVGERNWKETKMLKYYSLPNMARRLMLYNFDEAIKFPFVVLCEGPIDVWSAGAFSVATFGKNPSFQQIKLLCQHWPQAIVILLDGDAYKDTLELAEKLKTQQYRGHIIPVRLPVDKDPGGLRQSLLLEYIMTAADKHGIDLLSLKREAIHAYNDDAEYNDGLIGPVDRLRRELASRRPV